MTEYLMTFNAMDAAICDGRDREDVCAAYAKFAASIEEKFISIAAYESRNAFGITAAQTKACSRMLKGMVKWAEAQGHYAWSN